MIIRNAILTLIVGMYLCPLWGQIITPSIENQSKLIERGILPNDAFTFDISLDVVRNTLSNAPNFNTQKELRGIDLDLTLPNGKPIVVQLHEAPVSHPDHYLKYPDNKTYKITGGDDTLISGRLAISPRGVRGLIYTESQTVFIESLDNDLHVSYIYTKGESFSCDSEMHNLVRDEVISTRTSAGIGDQLRDYKIALASSGEWSNHRGDNLTIINDDINTYLTALNAIFERELATTFTLIADNDDLIFFNPVTDGFETSNRTGSAHTVISGVIPAADYDIGHVFYEMPGTGTSGSGVAGLGVTCRDVFKARGWTGAKGSYSVSFFMGVFAHEVGHQFGATHSYYGTSANCANRSAGAGYEPGSGNSLMSYEGICWQTSPCTESHDITPVSNSVYFHANSLEQMLTHVGTFGCVTPTATGNTPPIVTVPSNKTIPKSTPFEITGSGTDANGDPLVYNWEEYDTDALVLSCPDGNPNDAATSTTAPLFRSMDPTSDGNYRSFPKLSDIVGNVQTKGEILPTVARDIKLRLMARDFNATAGGVNCEDVTLTVDGNSGPFEVTIANSVGTAYQSAENVTVTWNVNNTDSSPINCTNVEILFSIDGGLTYPITLAASTANDGSHPVTMPINGTTQGRIKIKAIGNYFFDVNNEDITIISSCTIDAGVIINTNLVTEDAGDPALDLMLQSGIEVTQMSSSLDNTDQTALLTCMNTSDNSCTFFGNTPFHETQALVPDITGIYTFSRSFSYNSVINIYEISYDNNNVCLNWIASSGAATGNSISLGSSVMAPLTAGSTYIVKFSAFSNGVTGAYTVSFSNSVGGKLYEVEPVAPAGYTSSYVVVDNSNNIMGIDTSPDMTDDNIYVGGNYTVHGLSYISSTDLSSYINGPFSAFESDVLDGTVCGDFTSNTKPVLVNGCTPGTKTVTNTSNSGTGTLRMLMTDACAGDNIVFSSSIPSNTVITLTSEILANRTVSVDGSAVNGITISGGATNRIFQVPSGLTLTLSDLSLQNGFSTTNGGAFYNLGEMKLSDVIIENNFEGTTAKSFTSDGDVIIENGTVLIKE